MSSQLWRAVAVYRIVTLLFASILIISSDSSFARPAAAYAALALMIAWTAFTIGAYSRPRGRNPWLVSADVLVACGLIYSTRLIDTSHQIQSGAATIPTYWAASAILAAAVYAGPWAGMAAALPVWAADLLERWTLPTTTTVEGLVLLLVTGGVGGFVVRLSVRAEAAIDSAARRDAAIAERERIARDIHDSVLQVLALVSIRGQALGGEAADLGRLAAEQEAALRTLVSGDSVVPDAQSGLVDVRALIQPLAGTRITVSCPATSVLLPPARARALAAAAGAAVDNVRRHAGETARGWVLVEDDGDAVLVSVRDDGHGFRPDRLAVAAADGRLGVSQSIIGRLREAGGTATVTSQLDEGTEVYLRVAKR